MQQIGQKNFIVSKKSRLLQAVITSVISCSILIVFQLIMQEEIRYKTIFILVGLLFLLYYFVFPLLDGRKQYSIEEELPEPMMYELIRGYGVAQLLKKGGGMGTLYVTNQYFYFHPDRSRLEQTTVLCGRHDIAKQTLKSTFLGDAILTIETKKGKTHRFLVQNIEEWQQIL